MDLKFEFSYETKFQETFRTKSLIGQYDLENKNIIQHFKGNYKLPDKWNVGLIVGNSGTGKTSIAKNAFGDFKKLQWDQNPIIENFSDKFSIEQITECLGSVGFNSVPYWLKPFSVLSNGEKQRVELARLALENDFVLFDEFSSMVDRDVAKSMANSVQKLFRKYDKQLICVTCHKDLNAWLKPNWVYDTDEKVFFCQKNMKETYSLLTLEKHRKTHGNILKSIII